MKPLHTFPWKAVAMILSGHCHMNRGQSGGMVSHLILLKSHSSSNFRWLLIYPCCSRILALLKSVGKWLRLWKRESCASILLNMANDWHVWHESEVALFHRAAEQLK